MSNFSKLIKIQKSLTSNICSYYLHLNSPFIHKQNKTMKTYPHNIHVINTCIKIVSFFCVHRCVQQDKKNVMHIFFQRPTLIQRRNKLIKVKLGTQTQINLKNKIKMPIISTILYILYIYCVSLPKKNKIYLGEEIDMI